MPHLKALLFLISFLQSTVTAMIIIIIIVNIYHTLQEREGGGREREKERLNSNCWQKSMERKKKR